VNDQGSTRPDHQGEDSIQSHHYVRPDEDDDYDYIILLNLI